MNGIKAPETLIALIPLLDKKILRPVYQQSKTGLTPMQLHVMYVLKEKTTSTMTELANEMVMPKQQMTLIIDKLVSQRLVQREYDLIDRRIIRISLTSSGLNLLETHKKDALQILNVKLECLDQQDLTCLDVSLTNLYKILSKVTLTILTTIAAVMDCYI